MKEFSILYASQLKDYEDKHTQYGLSKACKVVYMLHQNAAPLELKHHLACFAAVVIMMVEVHLTKLL